MYTKIPGHLDLKRKELLIRLAAASYIYPPTISLAVFKINAANYGIRAKFEGCCG